MEEGYKKRVLEDESLELLKRKKATVEYPSKPAPVVGKDPVTLVVNHFPMKMDTFVIYQYHIDFDYQLGEEMLAGRKRRLFQLVYMDNKIPGLKCVMKKDDRGKDVIDPKASDQYVTDGNQLFTRENLFESDINLEVDFTDRRQQTYKLKLIRVKVFQKKRRKTIDFLEFIDEEVLEEYEAKASC